MIAWQKALPPRANASELRPRNRRLPNHEVRIMKEKGDGPEKAGMTSIFCGSLFGNLRLDGVPGAK
jgi:hypothetical protein